MPISKLDKLKIDFILDDKVWSFSSISNYNNCPKCFYLSYLQDPPLDKESNAFAQWGTLCHSLLERYVKDELELYELGAKYEEEYDKIVTLFFPFNKYVDLNEKYYLYGKEYFNSFNGFSDDWEIVDSEKEIHLDINGNMFIGYIDLIVRDKNNREYIIIDHKSKAKFKDEKEQAEYARQLYLYSLYIKQTYGKYPSRLIFNMFRANEIINIAFNEQALNEAVNWFVNSIKDIKKDNKFLDKIKIRYIKNKKRLKDFKRDDYFCNNLCGVRRFCMRSREYENKKGDTDC